MQYGFINSDSIGQFNTHWQGATAAPSDVALAIALCMPSVSEGGVRAKGAALKRPGLATYYHAMTLSWGDGDLSAGCRDADFFKVQLAMGDKVSNKTNHLTWLGAEPRGAGLIANYAVNGVRRSALTDAGLAQVKAVSPELAKLAKGYTVKAFEAATRAAAKAAKPVTVKKPVKAKKAKPVEGEQVIDVAVLADNAVDAAQVEQLG